MIAASCSSIGRRVDSTLLNQGEGTVLSTRVSPGSETSAKPGVPIACANARS